MRKGSFLLLLFRPSSSSSSFPLVLKEGGIAEKAETNAKASEHYGES